MTSQLNFKSIQSTLLDERGEGNMTAIGGIAFAVLAAMFAGWQFFGDTGTKMGASIYREISCVVGECRAPAGDYAVTNPNAISTELDLDGDGVNDVVALDIDGDGTPELFRNLGDTDDVDFSVAEATVLDEYDLIIGQDVLINGVAAEELGFRPSLLAEILRLNGIDPSSATFEQIAALSGRFDGVEIGRNDLGLAVAFGLDTDGDGALDRDVKASSLIELFAVNQIDPNALTLSQLAQLADATSAIQAIRGPDGNVIAYALDYDGDGQVDGTVAAGSILDFYTANGIDPEEALSDFAGVAELVDTYNFAGVNTIATDDGTVEAYEFDLDGDGESDYTLGNPNLTQDTGTGVAWRPDDVYDYQDWLAENDLDPAFFHNDWNEKFQFSDENEDGIVDFVGVDVDGDGEIDFVNPVKANGLEFMDGGYVMVDTNGDGVTDRMFRNAIDPKALAKEIRKGYRFREAYELDKSFRYTWDYGLNFGDPDKDVQLFSRGTNSGYGASGLDNWTLLDRESLDTLYNQRIQDEGDLRYVDDFITLFQGSYRDAKATFDALPPEAIWALYNGAPESKQGRYERASGRSYRRSSGGGYEFKPNNQSDVALTSTVVDAVLSSLTKDEIEALARRAPVRYRGGQSGNPSSFYRPYEEFSAEDIVRNILWDIGLLNEGKLATPKGRYETAVAVANANRDTNSPSSSKGPGRIYTIGYTPLDTLANGNPEKLEKQIADDLAKGPTKKRGGFLSFISKALKIISIPLTFVNPIAGAVSNFLGNLAGGQGFLDSLVSAGSGLISQGLTNVIGNAAGLAVDSIVRPLIRPVISEALTVPVDGKFDVGNVALQQAAVGLGSVLTTELDFDAGLADSVSNNLVQTVAGKQDLLDGLINVAGSAAGKVVGDAVTSGVSKETIQDDPAAAKYVSNTKQVVSSVFEDTAQLINGQLDFEEFGTQLAGNTLGFLTVDAQYSRPETELIQASPPDENPLEGVLVLPATRADIAEVTIVTDSGGGLSFPDRVAIADNFYEVPEPYITREYKENPYLVLPSSVNPDSKLVNDILKLSQSDYDRVQIAFSTDYEVRNLFDDNVRASFINKQELDTKLSEINQFRSDNGLEPITERTLTKLLDMGHLGTGKIGERLGLSLDDNVRVLSTAADVLQSYRDASADFRSGEYSREYTNATEFDRQLKISVAQSELKRARDDYKDNPAQLAAFENVYQQTGDISSATKAASEVASTQLEVELDVSSLSIYYQGEALSTALSTYKGFVEGGNDPDTAYDLARERADAVAAETDRQNKIATDIAFLRQRYDGPALSTALAAYDSFIQGGNDPSEAYSGAQDRANEVELQLLTQPVAVADPSLTQPSQSTTNNSASPTPEQLDSLSLLSNASSDFQRNADNILERFQNTVSSCLSGGASGGCTSSLQTPTVQSKPTCSGFWDCYDDANAEFSKPIPLVTPQEDPNPFTRTFKNFGLGVFNTGKSTITGISNLATGVPRAAMQPNELWNTWKENPAALAEITASSMFNTVSPVDTGTIGQLAQGDFTGAASSFTAGLLPSLVFRPSRVEANPSGIRVDVELPNGKFKRIQDATVVPDTPSGGALVPRSNGSNPSNALAPTGLGGVRPTGATSSGVTGGGQPPFTPSTGGPTYVPDSSPGPIITPPNPRDLAKYDGPSTTSSTGSGTNPATPRLPEQPLQPGEIEVQVPVPGTNGTDYTSVMRIRDGVTEVTDPSSTIQPPLTWTPSRLALPSKPNTEAKFSWGPLCLTVTCKGATGELFTKGTFNPNVSLKPSTGVGTNIFGLPSININRNRNPLVEGSSSKFNLGAGGVGFTAEAGIIREAGTSRVRGYTKKTTPADLNLADVTISPTNVSWNVLNKFEPNVGIATDVSYTKNTGINIKSIQNFGASTGAATIFNTATPLNIPRQNLGAQIRYVDNAFTTPELPVLDAQTTSVLFPNWLSNPPPIYYDVSKPSYPYNIFVLGGESTFDPNSLNLDKALKNDTGNVSNPLFLPEGGAPIEFPTNIQPKQAPEFEVIEPEIDPDANAQP